MNGIHIGTSGWTYSPWAGTFYPDGLPRNRWRAFYTSRFETVELNSSFYRWPGVHAFERWGRSLPNGFTMSVKASRWLSHGHRLHDPGGAWVDRLTGAMRALGDRAGVVLVQLPGDFARNDERLGAFLDRVPSGFRLAVELRHPSWDHDHVANMLADHGCAYVVTHGRGLHTVVRETASFMYCRWHGPVDQPLYSGRYSRSELASWAGHIKTWHREGRDVWGYFDNDGSGYAPANAHELRDLLEE